MEHARDIALAVLLGLLVGAGIRAAEWLIPAPELRVVFCLVDGERATSNCKRLEQLMKAPQQ